MNDLAAMTALFALSDLHDLEYTLTSCASWEAWKHGYFLLVVLFKWVSLKINSSAYLLKIV